MWPTFSDTSVSSQCQETDTVQPHILLFELYTLICEQNHCTQKLRMTIGYSIVSNKTYLTQVLHTVGTDLLVTLGTVTGFTSTRRQRFDLPHCHIFLCFSSILAEVAAVQDGGEHSTATTTAAGAGTLRWQTTTAVTRSAHSATK